VVAATVGIVIDEAFLAHQNPPGHPERAERMKALLKAVASSPLSIRHFPPLRAEREWIERVHDQAHFNLIQSTRGRAHSMLDPDTYAGPNSFDTACLAAGTGVGLLKEMEQGNLQVGFALVRPPGHHAERSRAMGFCLFNNVAVAAQWARDAGMAERVAVIDFDVHHGNGTEDIFWDRADVLYVSSHQHPLYPGTGRMDEVGIGPGEGYTVNLPLPPERDDRFIVPLYQDAVLPVLEEYGPDLIIVSAGYDAHARDPLAGMKMTEAGFAALSSLLVGTARELCSGRILFSLEGGYDLDALAGSVIASIKAAINPNETVFEPEDNGEHEAYLSRVRQQLGRYWKGLGL
jgi:acetoin utilization deacetylase AcuC-like enzyme